MCTRSQNNYRLECWSVGSGVPHNQVYRCSSTQQLLGFKKNCMQRTVSNVIDHANLVHRLFLSILNGCHMCHSWSVCSSVVDTHCSQWKCSSQIHRISIQLLDHNWNGTQCNNYGNMSWPGMIHEVQLVKGFWPLWEHLVSLLVSMPRPVVHLVQLELILQQSAQLTEGSRSRRQSVHYRCGMLSREQTLSAVSWQIQFRNTSCTVSRWFPAETMYPPFTVHSLGLGSVYCLKSLAPCYITITVHGLLLIIWLDMVLGWRW